MGEAIIGIDLGTTNSCAAVLEAGKQTVIHNREGNRTTPSVVAFCDNNECLVGDLAKRQAITNPKRTFWGIKRLIGRKYDSPEVLALREVVPYDIVEAPNGDAWVSVDGKTYSPPEIVSFILELMRSVAEDYVNEKVTKAIITVPAYFDDSQRQATKDAGRIAGLDVQRIINEPTAAALAYGLHKREDQTIAVFDLGGGTFDVSLLRVQSGVFEVLATNGDTFLGGEDFDRRLMEYLIDDFFEKTGVDLGTEAMALQRIKDAAEKAKKELSQATTTSINIPFIAANESGPLHLVHEDLSRYLLESLVAEELDRLETPCLQALRDAGIQSREVDQVILVGGMTRMPAVQERVEKIFQSKPTKGVNPDEIVAIGAATQSGIISGELQEVVLLDVSPHSLGIRVKGGRFSPIIPRNSKIPTRRKKAFATTEDNQDIVVIEVYQGEAEAVDENRLLGRFHLGGLPRATAGKIMVEVSFTIDTDGIVQVTAQETQTGKETSVTITASSGLTPSQLEKIIASKRESLVPA